MKQKLAKLKNKLKETTVLLEASVNAALQSETEKQRLENEYFHYRVYFFSDLHRYTLQSRYVFGLLFYLGSQYVVTGLYFVKTFQIIAKVRIAPVTLIANSIVRPP